MKEFTNQQIKQWVAEVQKQYGRGWSMIGEDYQEAAIFRKAYTVITTIARYSSSVPSQAIEDVSSRMIAVAFPNR